MAIVWCEPVEVKFYCDRTGHWPSWLIVLMGHGEFGYTSSQVDHICYQGLCSFHFVSTSVSRIFTVPRQVETHFTVIMRNAPHDHENWSLHLSVRSFLVIINTYTYLCICIVYIVLPSCQNRPPHSYTWNWITPPKKPFSNKTKVRGPGIIFLFSLSITSTHLLSVL